MVDSVPLGLALLGLERVQSKEEELVAWSAVSSEAEPALEPVQVLEEEPVASSEAGLVASAEREPQFAPETEVATKEQEYLGKEVTEREW